MMNEHTAASKNFVTREGEWRFQDQRGSVAARMPIRQFPPFSELAILTFADATIYHFAARVIHTDDWAHFWYLRHWMLPIVERYLTASERYRQIAEMVAKTHRLTQ